MNEEDENLGVFNSSPMENTSPGTKPNKKIFDSVGRLPISKTTHAGMRVHGTNLNIGKSKYDQGITWGTNIDEKDIQGSLNEFRYQNQSGVAQIGAGLGRATVKAASEILKLPGVIGGLIAAPFVPEGEGFDTIFNNPWIKMLDGVNEHINTEILPVYVGKAIKEGDLWDNITSTSFWATDGADGLGYMVGMMAPGAIINKLGLGAKMISSTAKAARLLKMGNLVEDGISGLKVAGISGKTLNVSTSAIANTVFESGAEAKGVGDAMDAKKDQFITNRTSKILKEINLNNISEMIQAPFELVQNPDGTQSMQSQGLIPNPEYQKLIEHASVQAESEFKEQRALAMRDTFKTNLGILIIPNLLMAKAIWGKAGNKLVATTEKTGMQGIAQRGGQVGKRWAGAFASEGYVEEAGQSTVERMFVDKAMNNELNREEGTLNDFSVGEFTKNYVETINSTEGAKAIFLGGMMGGPMMSYQGRKEDLENRRVTNEILGNVNSKINNFNKILENDIYKTNEDGSNEYVKDIDGNDTNEKILDKVKAREVIQALNFKEKQSKILDKAIEEGDTDVVRLIHQQAVLDMISPAIHNNKAGLDALEQQLKESTQFQEIISRDLNAAEKDKSSNFVKETLNVARHLQEQNEKFQDFAGDVIDLKNPVYEKDANGRDTKKLLSNDDSTPADKKEFLSRLNAQYIAVKYSQYNSEKNLKVLEKKRNDMLEELGVNNQMTPEEILKNNSQINSIASTNEAFSKVLKSIGEEKESIAKNKKDIIEVWNGKNAIDKSFKEYMLSVREGAKEVSDEEETKHTKILEDLANAETNQELNEIINNAHLTDEEISLLDPKIIQNQEDSIEEQGLIQEQINQKIKSEKITRNKTGKELVSINKSINDLESALEVVLKGSIEDVDSIMKTIDERSKLFNSKTKLNTKKGEINTEQIKDLKQDIRNVNKLANEIQSKIRSLNIEKQELERLKKVTNDRIQQYHALLGENLDFTKLTSKIKRLEKKAKKVDGLINNITKVINDLITSLKELFGYISKFENQLNNFEENNDFQVLDTAELKSLLLEGKGQDYGRLKNIHDKITDQLLTALDHGEITQEIYDQKDKELKDLIKTLHRTYSQLDLLKGLLIEDQIEIVAEKNKERPTIVDNPVIAEKIAEKQEELADIERFEQEAIDRQAFEEFIANEQYILENPEIITTPPIPTPTPIQENDTVELGEEDETMNDTLVTSNENYTEDQLTTALQSIQPGAKVISTNRNTGEKLEWIENSYIDYEREARDKSKDSVTFSIGEEFDDDNVKIALETLNNGILEDAENNSYENQAMGMYLYLPIVTTFQNKTSSFLEAFPLNGSIEAKQIFVAQSLPLRKKIINSLLAGVDIKDISTNIVKQFPGRLQVEPVNTFNHNNVLDLDFFKNMTEDQKKEAFVDNAYYVGYDGLKASVLDPNVKLLSKNSKGKGEVFLQIPMNNGKPFSLKLNFSRISEEKALAIYEIMKELSIARNLNDDFKNQLITISDFLDHMREVSPERANMIETTLAPEIDLINKTFREPVSRNLDVLLDVLVYQKSLNPRTLFRFDTGTNFQVGGLKINKAPISISVDDFQNDIHKDHIISFLKNKRHNVLISKNKPMSFNNKYYIDYILNNKILNTNALVNQPTFQGYSNIYLNSEISIKESGKPKQEVVTNVETIEPTQEIISDVISDKDFNTFIDSGQVSFEILNNIADKIKSNIGLSIREVAIHGSKTSEIEDLLKEIVKIEPVIQPEVIKQSPEKINVSDMTEDEAATIANTLLEDENINDLFDSIDATIEGKQLLSEMLKVLTDRKKHTDETKKYCGL